MRPKCGVLMQVNDWGILADGDTGGTLEQGGASSMVGHGSSGM